MTLKEKEKKKKGGGGCLISNTRQVDKSADEGVGEGGLSAGEIPGHV